MTSRQPILETTPQSLHESFHCEVVRGSGYGARWHFHPEVQLTLVLKSSGYRIVGDNISPPGPGRSRPCRRQPPARVAPGRA